MLALTKVIAIGIAVWFYMAADEHGEPPFKWVLIGLIGYIIVWFLADFAFDNLLATQISRSGAVSFLVGQFPAFAGLAVAYFIRKKMIQNLVEAKEGQKQ